MQCLLNLHNNAHHVSRLRSSLVQEPAPDYPIIARQAQAKLIAGIATRPKTMSAEIAVPIPTQVRSVVLLKRNIAALRAFAATGDLRIV